MNLSTNRYKTFKMASECKCDGYTPCVMCDEPWENEVLEIPKTKKTYLLQRHNPKNNTFYAGGDIYRDVTCSRARSSIYGTLLPGQEVLTLGSGGAKGLLLRRSTLSRTPYQGYVSEYDLEMFTEEGERDEWRGRLVWMFHHENIEVLNEDLRETNPLLWERLKRRVQPTLVDI